MIAAAANGGRSTGSKPSPAAEKLEKLRRQLADVDAEARRLAAESERHIGEAAAAALQAEQEQHTLQRLQVMLLLPLLMQGLPVSFPWLCTGFH